MDERVKVLSALIFIFTIVSLKSPTLLIPICVISLIIAFRSRVRIKTLLYPLYVASVVFLVVLFTEGSVKALTILLKVLSSTSILLSLTPSKVVSALSLILPADVVEIAELMVRYVKTMKETGETLLASAKARGAFLGGFRSKAKNLGIVAGMLIVKAYDKADRVYTCMVARGYEGPYVDRRLDLKSLIYLLTFILLCLGLVAVDRL